MGSQVPGLSSLPNSKPHNGHTSYDGLPSQSSYGGVIGRPTGGGQTSYGFTSRPTNLHTGHSYMSPRPLPSQNRNEIKRSIVSWRDPDAQSKAPRPVCLAERPHDVLKSTIQRLGSWPTRERPQMVEPRLHASCRIDAP